MRRACGATRLTKAKLEATYPAERVYIPPSPAKGVYKAMYDIKI